MTRKRFVKLLMSKGFSPRKARNIAQYVIEYNRYCDGCCMRKSGEKSTYELHLKYYFELEYACKLLIKNIQSFIREVNNRDKQS